MTTAISASTAPSAAHDEIAERHDAGLRGRGARQHDGDDAAADIGAEHQHHAELERQRARVPPAPRRAGSAATLEWNSQVMIAASRKAVAGSLGKIVHDHRQDLAFAQRLGRLADQPQRQDEQADADQDAAELQEDAALGRHEEHRAGDQAERHQQAEIEAEQLDDQRRTDIGAEHREQAGRAADDARAGERADDERDGGGALQRNGQRRPAPPQAADSSGSCAACAQHVAIGALDAGAHLPRREQKQRDRAGKVQKDEGAAHRDVRSGRSQAAPARRCMVGSKSAACIGFLAAAYCTRVHEWQAARLHRTGPGGSGSSAAWRPACDRTRMRPSAYMPAGRVQSSPLRRLAR